MIIWARLNLTPAFGARVACAAVEMYRYELDTLQPFPEHALRTADQEEGVDYGSYGFMFSVRAKNVPIVITGIQVRAGALACRAQLQRTIGAERPMAPHQRLLSLSACRARDQPRPGVARFLVAALTAPPRPSPAHRFARR
jgi:hypothetical protein